MVVIKTLAIIISKLVHFLGKLLGRGSSLPGEIAMKIDKNILNKLKLPETVIMVTGSNGKTTTTEMIASVFEENGYTVGYNYEGSNLTAGVATMLLNYSDLRGNVKKDVIVIESDERFAKYTCKYIKPKYFVVTNLYRDQLTRNGHPELIYKIIGDAITDEMHLILNTDDPLSSQYGIGRKKVTYVGVDKTDLSMNENTSVYNDAVYCPYCKEKLKYEYYHFSHIGNYRCTKCGHKKQDADYKVTNLDLNTGKVTINEKETITLSMKSFYNVYNSLFAYAVASLEGIKGEDIAKSLDNYTIKNDRVQTFKVNDKEIGMLLTSKHENSISYNQSIDFIIRENIPCTVVVLIDAISRKYYTSETSWLWDIDFEKLNSPNVKNIIAAGKYAYDIAVRLKYTDIDENKVSITTDLDELDDLVNKHPNEKVYLVTCFSDRMKFLNRRK